MAHHPELVEGEAPLSVNPEQAPGFRPESRRVNPEQAPGFRPESRRVDTFDGAQVPPFRVRKRFDMAHHPELVEGLTRRTCADTVWPMSVTLAVIATGGKQYLVRPGDVVRVEKLAGDEGAPVTFSDVLLVVNGTDVAIGTPTVPRAAVRGSIVKHGRADKVVGVKFKAKKRYKRTFGHRQHFTEVRIDTIQVEN